MKSSVSDSNFSEAGQFYHEGKSGLGYQNGASDGAIDLTSAKMSTGKIIFLVIPHYAFASFFVPLFSFLH